MGRLSDIELRLLHVFLAVVDAGGFYPAQSRLNLSLSTISSQMKSLEERLGTRLCHRGRAGFSLTPEGQRLHLEAQALFSAIERFSDSAARLRGGLSGQVTLGVVDSMVTNPCAPLHQAIRRFHRRKNRVHIDMRVAPKDDLETGVLTGTLDIGIGPFARNQKGLVARWLFSETQAVYCGRGHLLFDLDKVSTENLRDQPVASRGYWNQRDLDRIGSRNHRATANNLEAQLVLVLSGQYVGYLPRHMAAPWARAGKLREIDCPGLTYESDFSMITRRGRPASDEVAALTEDIAAEFQAAAPAASARQLARPGARGRTRAAPG